MVTRAYRRQALPGTYQQCHDQFEIVLKSMLDFYEISPPALSLSCIARDYFFAKMKEVEHSDQFDEPWLRARNGAPKVRRAQVGGFRDELGLADIAFLNEIFRL